MVGLVAVQVQAARLELEAGAVVEAVARLTLRPGETLPMRVWPA